jgi:hypothetical protein
MPQEAPQFFYFVSEQPGHGKRKNPISKGKSKSKKQSKRSQGDSAFRSSSFNKQNSTNVGKKKSSVNKKNSRRPSGNATSSARPAFWSWLMCSCSRNAHKDVTEGSHPNDYDANKLRSLNSNQESQNSLSWEDEKNSMLPVSSADELREEEDEEHSLVFRQLEDAGQITFDQSSDFGAHGLNSRNTSAYNTFGFVEDASVPNSRNVSIYRLASEDSGATPRLDCSADSEVRQAPLLVVSDNQTLTSSIDNNLSIPTSCELIPIPNNESEYEAVPPAVRALRETSLRIEPVTNSLSNDINVLATTAFDNSTDHVMEEHPPVGVEGTILSNSANFPMSVTFADSDQFSPLPVASPGPPSTTSPTTPPLPPGAIVNRGAALVAQQNTVNRRQLWNITSQLHIPEYECESGDSDTGSQSITLSLQSSVFDMSCAPSAQPTPSYAYAASQGFFRAGSFRESYNPSPSVSRGNSVLITPPQSYYGSGSNWAAASQPSGASVVSSSTMEQAIQASLEEERVRREQELAYRRAMEQAMQQSLTESSSAPNREHYDLMQHRMRLEQQRRIQLLQAMAQQMNIDVTSTAGENSNTQTYQTSVSDESSVYGGNSDTSVNSATIAVGNMLQDPSVCGDYNNYYR